MVLLVSYHQGLTLVDKREVVRSVLSLSYGPQSCGKHITITNNTWTVLTNVVTCRSFIISLIKVSGIHLVNSDQKPPCTDPQDTIDP